MLPHRLVVTDVTDASPASISNAHQNGILRAGDYVVGVNDHYPDAIDALVQLAERSRHRRVLHIARPKHHHDEDARRETITI